jgi:peptide/nickel transport system substrate-binding protein
MLEPYAADLLPGALEGYALPVGDGSERNRANIARALALMEEAGWTVQDGAMKDAGGRPFAFEILLTQGANEPQQIVDIFAGGAVAPRHPAAHHHGRQRAVHRAHERLRLRHDVVHPRPVAVAGQRAGALLGVGVRRQPGSRNWMGVKSPAIDGLIQTMLTSRAARTSWRRRKALDRVLTTGRYVIPVWHNPVSYIAHREGAEIPEALPIYGDFIGWMPDVWWYEE